MTRTGDDRHECPAKGCTLTLPYNILACRPHWGMLPQALKNRINYTWRNRSDSIDDYLQARQDAEDWWEANA